MKNQQNYLSHIYYNLSEKNSGDQTRPEGEIILCRHGKKAGFNEGNR